MPPHQPSADPTARPRRIPIHPTLAPLPESLPLTFTFDGEQVAARSGETLAVALITAGVTTFRTMPESKEPRGGYCLVGRCTDCLVQVDGAPNTRACVTPVRDGMRVSRQHGLGAFDLAMGAGSALPPPAAFSAPAGEAVPPAPELRHAQVAVVGGGPAGLAAAIAAAERGAKVVLFDEWPELGGRLRAESAPLHLPWHPEAAPVPPPALAAHLAQRAASLGVELHPAAVVWGAFPGLQLQIAPSPGAGAGAPPHAGSAPRAEPTNAARPPFALRVEQLIVATGATDLPCPFPGATLPGVWSCQALALLLHRDRLLPGRRFAVLGGGREAAMIASAIEQSGAQSVVALDPAGHDLRAEGEGRVRRLVVDGASHEVDGIVVAVGRQPDAALALIAGADPDTYRAGASGARLDDHQRTSLRSILVAGDAHSPGTTEEALQSGRRAGLSAAVALDLATATELDPPRPSPRGTAHGYQPVSPPKRTVDNSATSEDPGTTPPCLICRCEQIGERAVRDAIATGARTVNDVKRQTRAGMGLCQGIFCVPVIAVLLAADGSNPPTTISPMTTRPPLRPLPLAHLAAATEAAPNDPDSLAPLSRTVRRTLSPLPRTGEETVG